MNPELMKRPGGKYRLDSIDNLWRKASNIIDDLCFGLKAAKLWHPSNFGSLGYEISASNTLRTALDRVERYHRFLSEAKIELPRIETQAIDR
jgi:hypothetical protein